MATDPVYGADFLKREEILALLNKRFSAFKNGYRQNMALVGSPGVGKSSILNQFLNSIQDSSSIPIIIDVPNGSLELFIKRFMASGIRGVLKLNNQSIPWEATELIGKAKKFIPKTVRHMREALKLANKNHWEEAYKKVFTLPSLLREETGCHIILVLDSFNHLGTLSIRDPFGILGKQIMIDKDTMYLVASSCPNKTRTVFREKLNLLFGNFEILDVKNFDFESARQFIRKKLEGFEINKTQENFLIQLTDAHPFYLSVLLDRIRDLLFQKAQLSLNEEILFQGLVEELLKSTGRIHQFFNCYYSMPIRSRNYLDPLQVLSGIALGHRKISRLAKYVGRKIVDTKKAVQKLMDEEVLKKEGSLFLIPDPLFRFWLKQVVTIGVLGYESDCSRKKEYFCHELKKYFNNCQAEDAKELPKRVEELLRHFAGDTLTVGASRVICHEFQDVVSKPSNGRIFPVRARLHKGSWMCQVAHDSVKEDDIRVFLNDVKEEKTKVIKKVLVAISGSELNAVLTAKNANIAIWDLKNLNQLMDVYDRPKVIV